MLSGSPSLSQRVVTVWCVVTRDEANGLLRDLTGDQGSRFRDGQWEAIERLAVHRGRVLVVQRTGWGKSAVYFLATRLLRDAGSGPTILISPLLALMRNQIAMAERLGVHAATINSSNVEEWERIETMVKARQVDVLLISPERLNNEHFRTDVLPHVVKDVGMLVVDEAHCISDWGHDFRPDYRRIARVLPLLPPGVPVLCTTATANDRVVEDIRAQLGDGLDIHRGPLDRESLELAVVKLPGQPQRLAWLATVIPGLAGCGIVYCLTVADTERVASWLNSRGISAMAYSGTTDNTRRVEIEDALLANDVRVVVATSALGMGFDKPDLAFVIHYQSPGSPIAYYQQVGRAGRAMTKATGVLLQGMEDVEIQDYFIATAFPPKEKAERVLGLLHAADAPMSLAEIEAHVNVRRSRLEAMLKILEVEGAVGRVGARWTRTARAWTYDEERVSNVTKVRRDEQHAMREYAETEVCRLRFLREQLDDPGSEDCGRCDNCTGHTYEVDLDRDVIRAAIDHLRRLPIEIEPRKQWPSGLTGISGRIPPECQLEVGRALSIYGDGGWGTTVREAKYGGQGFPDELVHASAQLIRAWSPQPAPTWVTSVPSSRALEDAAAFARRLAEAVNLPYVEVIRRVRETALQKEMENSAQQVGNALGAFEVATQVPPGPVLLVDDIVDSRWTLTVIGVALREAGSGEVLPFVLAKAVSS